MFFAGLAIRHYLPELAFPARRLREIRGRHAEVPRPARRVLLVALDVAHLRPYGVGRMQLVTVRRVALRIPPIVDRNLPGPYSRSAFVGTLSVLLCTSQRARPPVELFLERIQLPTRPSSVCQSHRPEMQKGQM